MTERKQCAKCHQSADRFDRDTAENLCGRCEAKRNMKLANRDHALEILDQFCLCGPTSKFADSIAKALDAKDDIIKVCAGLIAEHVEKCEKLRQQLKAAEKLAKACDDEPNCRYAEIRDAVEDFRKLRGEN